MLFLNMSVIGFKLEMQMIVICFLYMYLLF